MINHYTLWHAIEIVAQQNHFTCSGLARTSGLDATTFNKSKRFDCFGKAHYPSMLSLIKVLNAMDISMTQFGIICDAIAQEMTDTPTNDTGTNKDNDDDNNNKNNPST